ncbi:MAG: 2-C-methyl-D-erythritol 4-phosphate cytidylyltransferase [Chitinispirillaceae bacterium]|nr:2-C-methyl-D-erythritol 4-phosphate cytidylyltransferase [Chitinispirillaceae bacterium]
MQNRFDVIIVAAGSGTRLGFSTPKAFVPLAGKPMLRYSFDTFREHPGTENVILVVPETMIETARDGFSADKVTIVPGGAERWESARNGCDASIAEWVLVHDAARPFVTHAVIDALLEKSAVYDCAFSATPVVDTIRKYSGDTAGDTVDRSGLVRVGTPQLFRRVQLAEGLRLAPTMQPPPTDDAMLMQRMNIPVGLAWGDPTNFKITTREDLATAEALLRSHTDS